MRRELPTPEEILEELANKAAIQIDRLAPVAFDAALRELTRYHKFLLTVNASRFPDGKPFNFAAVPGEAWQAPHKEWIRQYRRLFERAASHIGDDTYFLEWLAHVPSRLLPRDDDPEMPDDVLQTIIDLGPIMIHQIEGWVTKRTVVENEGGSQARLRISLAGSDAKALEGVLPNIVGAWEGLLQSAPIIFQWEQAKQSDGKRWDALRMSWPFLRQHLHNTAYMLAVSVWNEDERGAALFREALVRWPQTLSYRFEDRTYLVDQRLLLPDVLSLDITALHKRFESDLPDYADALTPDESFGAVLRGVHNDILLITAALLLNWSMNRKQATDIGARTAADLLSNRIENEDFGDGRVQGRSFESLIMAIVRLELSGYPRARDTYGGELDRLVGSLDNMTERRVVPGRVFTPSTLHDRDGLKGALLALLLSRAPKTHDALLGRIRTLVSSERENPLDDRTLRDLQRSFSQYFDLLKGPLEELKRGAALLRPNLDFAASNERVASAISALINSVKNECEARLRSAVVDVTNLRNAAESAMLNFPGGVRFFKGFSIEKTNEHNDIDVTVIRLNNVTKEQLVESSSDIRNGLAESYSMHVSQQARRVAWNSFIGQPRKQIEAAGSIKDPKFWRRMEQLSRDVGAEPILLVSNSAEGRALRGIMRQPPAASFRIERKSEERLDGSYVATVNGIDIYGVDFKPKTAWLFSPFRLQSLRYGVIDDDAHVLRVRFEPTEDLVGSLVAEFKQQVVWADWAMYEIICD